MGGQNKLEVWLRGPLEGISPYLQPVGHALLQAREEVEFWMADAGQLYVTMRVVKAGLQVHA